RAARPSCKVGTGYHRAMRIHPLALLVVLGCGKDNPKTPDAAAGPDAAPLTLDCASYCSGIMARCTGNLAQYASMANCTDSCTHFAMGTLGQMMGNTLGCRVY